MSGQCVVVPWYLLSTCGSTLRTAAFKLYFVSDLYLTTIDQDAREMASTESLRWFRNNSDHLEKAPDFTVMCWPHQGHDCYRIRRWSGVCPYSAK